MKLNNIPGSNNVYLEYTNKLKSLLYKKPKLLTEQKVVITIEDDKKPAISQEDKTTIITQAKQIGKFDNSKWVNQLLNGMKQAGIHGVNDITEGQRPVTVNEINQLIRLLIDVLSK